MVGQNEKKFRISEIIKRIRKGYSNTKLKEWIKDQWNLSGVQAGRYMREAYELLAENADDVIEKTKVVQVERIEDLLVDALESNDRQTAVKALDMLNKIHSLYTQKNEVKIDSNNLKFSFGDDIEEENNDKDDE